MYVPDRAGRLTIDDRSAVSDVPSHLDPVVAATAAAAAAAQQSCIQTLHTLTRHASRRRRRYC